MVADSVTPMLRRMSVAPPSAHRSLAPCASFRRARRWPIEREVLRRAIDVVQVEYTNMGQHNPTAPPQSHLDSV